MEVIATGRIDTYADRSKYQLVIDRLDYAGEGALLARIERLRAAPARGRALRRRSASGRSRCCRASSAWSPASAAR